MEEKMVPIYICPCCETLQLKSLVSASVRIYVRVEEEIDEDGEIMQDLAEGWEEEITRHDIDMSDLIVEDTNRICVYDGCGCVTKYLIPLPIFNKLKSLDSDLVIPLDKVVLVEGLPEELRVYITSLLV